MTGKPLFAVIVEVDADGARASLMALASVLHRRGIDVVEAEFTRRTHNRRVFTATFAAEQRRATTVLRSYENLIDVLDASLYAALETDEWTSQ